MNELELVLMGLRRALKKQLDDNPKGGVKKGVYKIRYSEVMEGLQHLESFFGVRGSLSLGLCKDCAEFTQAGHSSPCWGHCNLRQQTHIYDSCHNYRGRG